VVAEAVVQRRFERWQPQNPAAWLRLAVLYGRQRDQAKAAPAFAAAESQYRSCLVAEADRSEV
jgi:hypothetical protein